MLKSHNHVILDGGIGHQIKEMEVDIHGSVGSIKRDKIIHNVNINNHT